MHLIIGGLYALIMLFVVLYLYGIGFVVLKEAYRDRKRRKQREKREDNL